MKRTTFKTLVIAAIALTSVGVSMLGLAHSITKQANSSNRGSIELTMNEPTPSEEAQQWEEMKQRFTAVGINLTPEQETQIRQAGQQLAADVRQNLGSNVLPLLGQLIAATTLPQAQGEALLRTTGLDQRLGAPILTYRQTVLNALTPEQHFLWEERIWNAQETQAEAETVEFSSPTSAEKAQEWQKTRQMFQDAGIALSPEQETQMQQANNILQAALEQEFRVNPAGTFARFFALTLLPQPVVDRIGENLLGSSVLSKFETVNRILTPEQYQVWERSFNQGN